VISPVVSRVLLLAPIAIGCFVGAAVLATETSSSAAGEGQAAVWTPKETTFVYQGFTTTYSCDGLRDKVWDVLLDLGAQKKGLQVTELGCSTPYGRPDPFPGVRIRMNVLQPVSGSSNTKQTPVPAHWKPVNVQLRNDYSNDSGECELIEQIRSKLLPLFATRNVDLQEDCVPHQASATRPTLKLEVLIADKPTGNASQPTG